MQQRADRFRNQDEPFKPSIRRRPAAGVNLLWDQVPLVFVTVCAAQRRSWIASAEVQNRLIEVWTAADAWLVGDFVLMPDHLHFFAAPRRVDIGLDEWICYWKSRFSRGVHRENWRWQSHAFHHRLRKNESFAQKWLYMRQNPVRAGLVERAEEWPFFGRVFDLIGSFNR